MPDTTLNDDSQGAVEQGKEQVQEKASELGDRIQQTARDQIDQRSTDAGKRVQTLSSDLRSVGERLREDGNERPANLADQVADRADRFGGYLSDSDANTILEDVEDFGRRQPWLALAGGVAVGIVSARLLKASSSSRYQARRQVSTSSTPPMQTQPKQTGATPTAARPQTASPVGAPTP